MRLDHLLSAPADAPIDFKPGRTGKQAFPSKAIALRYIEHRRRHHRVGLKNRGKMHVYRCEHCNGWHVGSQSQ